MDKVTLTDYDRSFLDLSWSWLNDPEIKMLTLAGTFTREEQEHFFESIQTKKKYLIYGVMLGARSIGVAGLKNIEDEVAEYWGYIGEKDLWGKGLGGSMIDEIIKIAQRQGIKKIYLKVSVNNTRAIKAYHKYGFTISESQPDIIFMEKEI